MEVKILGSNSDSRERIIRKSMRFPQLATVSCVCESVFDTECLLSHLKPASHMIDGAKKSRPGDGPDGFRKKRYIQHFLAFARTARRFIEAKPGNAPGLNFRKISTAER